MGGGVQTVSVYRDSAVVESYTFEADTLVEIYAEGSRTLCLSGFSISISDSTADACPVSITTAAGQEIFRVVLPLAKVTAGGYATIYTLTDFRKIIEDGKGLAIVGGASGAVLNATIFVSELTV